MNWITPALATVAIIHLLAIAFGRHQGDRVRQVALASGVVGLLSIPILFIGALKSVCIAGGCSRSGISLMDVTGTIVLLLALLSLVSVLLIGFHRRRA